MKSKSERKKTGNRDFFEPVCLASFPFLDATTHLYKRSCPSVRPSVGPYIRPVLFSKVKSTHTRRILCRVSGLVFLSQVSLSFLPLFPQFSPTPTSLWVVPLPHPPSPFPPFLQPSHYGTEQKKTQQKRPSNHSLSYKLRSE